MKKIIALIGLAILIISISVSFLLRKGISLRPEPIITPSKASVNLINVATSVYSRLYPKFQESDYLIWGILPFTAESQIFFENIKKEYSNNSSSPLTIINFEENSDPNLMQKCPQPCWILVGTEKAHQLNQQNSLIYKNLLIGKNYFSLSWVPFSEIKEIPESCIEEQRLDFDCFQSISLKKAERKLKQDHRYFFMNAYNDSDYFVFIQDKGTL